LPIRGSASLTLVFRLEGCKRPLDSLGQAGHLLAGRKSFVTEERFGVKFPDDGDSLGETKPPIQVVKVGGGDIRLRMPQMLESAVSERDGRIFFGEDLLQEFRIGARQMIFELFIFRLARIPLGHGARVQMLFGVIERRETRMVGDPELQREERFVDDVKCWLEGLLDFRRGRFAVMLDGVLNYRPHLIDAPTML
jgi:hypothetical protein